MWRNPTPYALMPTDDSESFKIMPSWVTGIPLPPHPGAFGVRRKKHTHEGVDLYLPISTPVSTVEAGTVLAVRPFTGPALGHDWWLPTHGVWVEGPSGVVVYGEIAPHVHVGQCLAAGELVGVVLPVLKKNKGRPVSMLHLELRVPGNTDDIEWLDHTNRPATLLDPTPFLLECVSLAV